MSRKRFDQIMSALKYTDKEAPTTFIDLFHEVRQMIDAFNEHYESEYSPSWLSCIDESMNVWLNKFCPGFMSLPRKPHPFGNEYHSIADGDKGHFILAVRQRRMEIVSICGALQPTQQGEALGRRRK
jgi:hypothetical protein